VLFSFWNVGILIVVVEAYIFSMGLGFLMSQLHVFFRDIRYIYNAISTMVLYCSAIFYDVGMFYEKAQDQIAAGSAPLALYLAKFVEYMNPFYIYIKQFRYFIWVPTLDTVPQWAAVTPMDFLLGFGYALLMLAIGVFFFRRSQDKFILYI
ncbi:MAG: hypothetical protein IKT78_04375, partial [Ruminiclostridium sp.]|nr:hypothetical protein [Ruminiclostridium sp.]